MENVKNYLALNQKLIQSMVIKSELHAQLINEEIELKYPNVGVDNTDPTTWKYYLNLAGLQHELNKDIYITSFDTQEEILFNSYNLSIHIQTRKNYLYGTKNYYILLKQYPEEELFIQGSLYPVDIHKAIAARDMQIISYDKSLVEPQESSLIYELQKFIDEYDVRWNVKAFVSSDELYPAAQYGIFILNLLQKLINVRLSKCMTHEAHSFHIKSYLASHYGLDQYVDYMTLQQSMFLYKNIRYIERNIGKVETFKTLVKKLIEDRNIMSLYELSIRQLHEVNEDFRPELLTKKTKLTNIVNASEKDYFSMANLNKYQKPLAIDNPWYLDNHYSITEHQLSTDDSNTIKTKYLLAEAVDYNDAIPYTFAECLMVHWVSWANSGIYNSYMSFINGLTETQNYLHVTDAFIYMLYLNKGYYKITDDVIPAVRVNRRLKHTKPNINELLALIPKEEHRYLRKTAQKILDGMPVVEPMITAEAFYNKCKEIHDYWLWQYFLISNTHDKDYEAYVKSMCDYMFVDESVSLDTPYNTFSEFTLGNGLPEYEDKPSKVVRTIKDIYDTSTNFAVDKFRQLKYVQEKLVEATLKLSSYSINFIKLINPDRIIPADWSAIRIGNIKTHVEGELYQPTTIDVNGVYGECVNYSLTDVALADTNPETAKYVSYTQVELVPIEFTFLNFNAKAYIENLVGVEKVTGTGSDLTNVNFNYLNIHFSGVSTFLKYVVSTVSIDAFSQTVNLTAPAYMDVGASDTDDYDRYISNLSTDELLRIPVI